MGGACQTFTGLDEEQLQTKAKHLAQCLHGGLVIYLEGKLGAGKTTFVRAMLRALGVTGAVKSPTYTLVEPYKLRELTLYHFDLYRLAAPDELFSLGVEDYFDDASVCCFEWPCHGNGAIAAPDLVLKLSEGETHQQRVLECQAESSSGVEVLQQWVKRE